MAQQPARRTAGRTPATFNEGTLTKGQLRKLNALRKSVGETIGTRAFAQWLTAQAAEAEAKKPVDKNAERIASVLEPLIDAKKLRIPRGGYLIKRGRGRVIVSCPGRTT